MDAAAVCLALLVLLIVFVSFRKRSEHKKRIQTHKFMTVTADDVKELQELRSGKWNRFQPVNLVPHTIQGKEHQLRAGLTFTPYADSSPCTAHCHFCSETLERTSLPNEPTPYDLPKIRAPLSHKNYFEAFQNLLEEFRSIPFTLGLSISGLEATADAAWIISLCDMLSHPRYQPIFGEKVLYTNGSGLVNDDIVAALRRAGVGRIELSRQHNNEAVNQKIMRFGNKVDIRKNSVYEQVVRDLTASTDFPCQIKNSCILTKAGISSIEDIEEYARWASTLGVGLIVFRELCQLSTGENGFVQNRTKTWIDENRVAMEDLAAQLVFPDPETGIWRSKDGWQYLQSTVGYYYYNEHYEFSGVEIILEVSSYNALQDALDERDTVDKMVFHSSGTLTSGWDPKKNILAQFSISQSCSSVDW